MAHARTVETHRLPMSTATAVHTFDPVCLANATTATSGQRTVRAIATVGEEPIGAADRTRNGANEPIRILPHPNIVRGIAQATVLYGENVGFATLASVAQVGGTGPTKQVKLSAVTGASGSAVWRAGIAQEAANPGEVFSYYFSPRQLSGLV